MVKVKTKPGDNMQRNFTQSAEVLYWSTRYHTPVEEIQQIFAYSGNSIAKTLETLKKRAGEI